ncbi:putative SnoaL-like aldol condensation-catalyzing enzyme [Nocardia transvalensis]|uniref:Putative SnoaL-like aldol condensation-catalyzing enzyme n=1 Tax=Nocardia transvalensis TaxID=37333 RepID=A0A7W9PBJ4_9NOCA|nr:ester cyclase [Nocardia transvalensis]MBB5912703.1 putative SnoaL-like aldol condensation-catalyzing enzyme [Nocardia transvalensis]
MDAETLYRSWLFEVWYGDYGRAEEIFAPGFVGHWPGQDVHGPREVVAQIEQSREFFDDIENTLDVGPLVDGDLVAARWTFHGSYREGIPGATVPRGTRIAFAGQDIFRVDDGRLAEYWVVSDGLGMMRSLGALGG